MIVIIDGYNLLKSIFYNIKGKLDKQRKQLINQLAFYKEKKTGIKDIIIVFDGGFSKHASREIHSEIIVIFAGQNSSADEWIFEYIEKNKNLEFLLVTKDRELIKNCSKYNVDSISGDNFYSIVQNEILKDVSQDIDENEQIIKKYKDNEYIDYEQLKGFKKNDNAVDLLMNQIFFNNIEKDDFQFSNKKSKLKKISKQDRKVLKKIKKL